MIKINAPPREGDIYKVVKVDQHRFELRFGFYADFERESGEPVVLYPDLNEKKIYTRDGRYIVTAIQEPCDYYEVSGNKSRDECCNDCIHFLQPGDEIGICKYTLNRKK